MKAVEPTKTKSTRSGKQLSRYLDGLRGEQSQTRGKRRDVSVWMKRCDWRIYGGGDGDDRVTCREVWVGEGARLCESERERERNMEEEEMGTEHECGVL